MPVRPPAPGGWAGSDQNRKGHPNRKSVIQMRTSKTVTTASALVAAALFAAGCATTHPVSRGGSSGATTGTQTTVQATPAAAPSPTANPAGTYQGSCDYILSGDINGNDTLVGEVDLVNTGNVGMIVHTRITWPQEGALPITARKTVHLPYGASKAVRFHVDAGGIDSNVITLLQSWQENHDYKDGCTYHAAFNVGNTYGPIHS